MKGCVVQLCSSMLFEKVKFYKKGKKIKFIIYNFSHLIYNISANKKGLAKARPSIPVKEYTPNIF